MEFEQIIKRMDWLDEEHRKQKIALSDALERIDVLESENKSLRKKNKELTTEMSRLSTAAGRMQEYENALTQHRKEIALFITDIEKRRDVNQQELEKRFRLELDGMNKSLADIKRAKESIAELKRGIKSLNDDETHRNRFLSEAQTKMEALVQKAEDASHAIKAAEENRRQESKRLADLQGEVAAMRKRLDETRQKTDITVDDIRRNDIRMSEIIAGETERRQAQANFAETQARLQVERDLIWKDWQEKVADLINQSARLDVQLQNWEAAQRSIKRARETYEEIAAKFERRINEITEIQRLGEDRFRQEWVTFKADSQKRWTSFTLSQDEIRKDTLNDIGKLGTRLTTVEDLAQTLQDIIQQTREADEQMLQGILAQIHELLSGYDRIKGTA